MWTQEFKQSLLEAKPLRYLENSELERLLLYSKVTTFLPGQVLQQQGRINHGMYIVLEGNAIVSTRVLGKDVIKLSTLEPGDFVGELLGNKPSTTSVVANTKVKCLFITKDYFNMLGNFFPEVKYKISKAIAEFVCHRIRRLHNKIVSILNKSEVNVYPIFSNVLKYFISAKNINLKDSGLEKNQIKDLFFHLFNEKEFEELFAYANLISAPKDFALIQKGEVQKSCYLVLRGAVQLSILHENKMAKLTVLGPATIICSLALVDNKPAILTYKTCERAILLKIPDDKMAMLQQKNILLWYKIYDLICQSIVNREEPTDRLFLRLNSEFYNE